MQIRENKTLKLKLSIEEFEEFIDNNNEINLEVAKLLVDKKIIKSFEDLEEIVHLNKSKKSVRIMVNIISTLNI